MPSRCRSHSCLSIATCGAGCRAGRSHPPPESWPMADVLLTDPTRLCGVCKRSIPAQLWRTADQIVMRKRCPEHGAADVVVSSSADWYAEIMQYPPVLTRPDARKAATQGCP